MCSSCDTGGSPPRYFKEDDSSCVLMTDCGDGYFWDTDGNLCRCKYGAKLYYTEIHKSSRTATI